MTAINKLNSFEMVYNVKLYSYLYYLISNKYCFDFRALEALINFAYSGRVIIDTNNVQSLMVGASFLQLQKVRDACTDFIKRR